MNNPWCHHIDCGYWHDHYDFEYTCSRPDLKPPAADPVQELRGEIAELKRRIERLEARVVAMLG
jgi:hypothetical protein